MIKNNKGITFITLIVTIIILIIIASTTIVTGIDVYKKMSVNNFISEMKLIQEKVNLIAERYKLSDNEFLDDYLTENGIISNTSTSKINTIEELETKLQDSGIPNLSNDFRECLLSNQILNNENEILGDIYFFNEQALQNNLGLRDLKDQAVIIDFKDRKVISVYGIKKNNSIYYTQYDLPNGDKIVKEVEIQKTTLEFSFVEEKLLYNNELTSLITLNNLPNNIYLIEYGEIVENNVSVWNKLTSAENKIFIKKTGKYRIKIQDINGNEGTQDVDVELSNLPRVSVAEIKVTNKFIWIPRFAYRIIEQNENTGEITNVEIKYLKENTYITTEDKGIELENWKVPKAFEKDGGKTGFWISKIELNEKPTITAEGLYFTIDEMTDDEKDAVKLISLKDSTIRAIYENELNNRYVIYEK